MRARPREGVVCRIFPQSMIRRVRAVEFQRPMTSGSKRPALFTCIDEDNKDLHVIVKLRGALPRDSFSCVAEYVSSVLAKDLRLESGDVVAVEVSQDLAQAVYDAGQVDFGRH
jgi:hypothetical protein